MPLHSIHPANEIRIIGAAMKGTKLLTLLPPRSAVLERRRQFSEVQDQLTASINMTNQDRLISNLQNDRLSGRFHQRQR